MVAGRCPGARRAVLSQRDRGSASLWLLAVGLLLVAAGLAGAAVGAARLAGRRAQVAADLGALAGAVRVIEGADAACARAAEVVAANGGRLIGCRADSLDLVITVRYVVRPLPGLERAVQASARAGPVRG
ncbi:Rv3654c family TadE-like protein [Plantactinospora siamensis]|uniref:Rv3654c family TadE-like protein n=1 Tax=Plantactinospora siamensis TaxID=555372 RepID=A0ABV6NVQ1_9ACTN